MMSRRLAKASQAVLETVSLTLMRHIRDPRVKNVTVLAAEVAPDMRTARVRVSVMGTAKEQSLCMYGLESAKGFIQSKIADRLETRYTPVLTFVLDQGVKLSVETSRALREIIPGETSEETSEGADDLDLEGAESADGEFDDSEFEEDEFEEDEDGDGGDEEELSGSEGGVGLDGDAGKPSA
jgi:ribosome-binding factor A